MKKLEAFGYASLIPPENATPHDTIETLVDVYKYAKFFKHNRDDINGIIVILPNFGDEIGVAQTLAMVKLNVPYRSKHVMTGQMRSMKTAEGMRFEENC